MITSTEILILFRILLAHVLADFFLQRYNWVVDKRTGVKSVYLYYHIGIVILLTYLFLGDFSNWHVPLFIGVTHFLVDWWKSSVSPKPCYFVLDQVLHISFVVIGWLGYIGYGLGDIGMLWQEAISGSFLIVLTAYLLVTRPAGFLIAKLTERWHTQMDKTAGVGLDKAGKNIGIAERIIILTFILMGSMSAIGFLIAAKSIFRFSGQDGSNDKQMMAEYILVGSLMSFLFAIITGIITQYFLSF